MKERLEATVYGFVQGVYFRHYTRMEAKSLGLTGWVANQMDGSVMVVAEGDKGQIQRFIEFLRRGSPKARVTNIKLNHLAPTNEFEDFYVRYL